jgi:ribose-phosphate pyrophosphokinase
LALVVLFETLMEDTDIAIFVPSAGGELGQAVCGNLGLPPAVHEEREFEDGEHKVRPLESVRGKDVFVVQSLYGDLAQSGNDKLVRLLFFLGALRDASARRVTAVVPYLCYARKDRRSKPRDPVTTRYVAALFEAVGTSGLVTLDVHNLAAFQNAFRIPADHLEAKRLFVAHFASLPRDEDAVVVSPDVGGVKRAEAFREALSAALGRNVTNAFVEKYRSADVVSGDALIGEVAGKHAIVIDDLVSSGTTLARAARLCKSRGAVKVSAAATHGLFTANANDVLEEAPLDHLVVTNAVPAFRLHSEFVRSKLTVLDIAPLLAETIRRIHTGGSIVELLE